MSDIGTAEAFWDSLALQDPLWAILSDPTRAGGRWDLESFFRTGEREISTLVYQIDNLVGGGGPAKSTALDFGCGVGRLSQALALSYESVVGVDVSARMIEHARRLHRTDRLTFVHNSRDDLTVLADRRFDLIYTDLVLQHMPPPAALKYLDEFLHLLSPGGMLVFQLPSHKRVTQPVAAIPMSPEAYRAGLSIVSGPERWTAGSSEHLRVNVRNDSRTTWDQGAAGSIRLGNHWLSPDGAMRIQDDGRSALPAVLHPGDSMPVDLQVTVPPGTQHLLELDLVHEGFSWFADQGSTPLRLTVSGVAAEATQEQSEGTARATRKWNEALLRPYVTNDASPSIEFPMHGVPRADVETFVQSRGASLLLVEKDDRGGPEWHGYRYFARAGERF